MGVRERREVVKIASLCSGHGRLVAAILTVSLSAACGPPRAPAQPTISLRIRGTPASANVVIDEESLGPLEFVAAHGVALPPGIHHVTVTANGYFPSDQVIDARPGSPPVQVQVALVPVPD